MTVTALDGTSLDYKEKLNLKVWIDFLRKNPSYYKMKYDVLRAIDFLIGDSSKIPSDSEIIDQIFKFT
jgi:hypothetical protein